MIPSRSCAEGSQLCCASIALVIRPVIGRSCAEGSEPIRGGVALVVSIVIGGCNAKRPFSYFASPTNDCPRQDRHQCQKNAYESFHNAPPGRGR